MTPTENLHYAIGELAYAIARADGTIHNEERRKFHDIVVTELEKHDYQFNISDIIFQVMDRSGISANDAYNWAMKQIRMNSHYLSPELKAAFISIAEKIAKAYKGISQKEKVLIDKFRTDIAPLNGDPVFYKQI